MKLKSSVILAAVAAVLLSLLGAVPAAHAATADDIGCVGAAPTNLTGVAGPFSGQVSLNWAADPTCPATDYEVRYRESTLLGWAPAETTGSPWSQYVVSGLSTGVSYVFQVRGFYGSGYSDWSTQSPAITPSVPSLPPTNVRAAASGTFGVTVAWTAPSPAPLSYQVQFRANLVGADWQPRAPYSTRATSIEVTDLTPGASYFFRVRAFYGGSDFSEYAATTTATSPGAPPAAPTSVTATPGNGQLVVTWVPQLGATATGYQVQYSPDGGSWLPSTPFQTPGNVLTYSISGLTNGVPYFVRVQAVNGPLTSGWTTSSTAVAPVGLPGQVTGLSGTPGNSQVTLNWTAPPASPSAPVTGYRGQYSSNGGAVWSPFTITGTATTAVVSGLANGTGYIFQVQAFNAAGAGPWSASTPVITPPGVPDAPTSVTATPGNGRATVSWTAPASPASPIIGYRVTSAPGGFTCTTSAVAPDVPATSCEVTGLSNGTAYSFSVTATNAFGVSPASDASAPVTPNAPAVKLRITGSGRDGGKVYANVATQGLDQGTVVTALVKYTKDGTFEPTGTRKVKADGTFRWALSTNSKVWVYFLQGSAQSRVAVIPARR